MKPGDQFELKLKPKKTHTEIKNLVTGKPATSDELRDALRRNRDDNA